MKTLLVIGYMLTSQFLMGSIGITGMKSKPPKAEVVGEIISTLYDAGPMGFETHIMTKSELARFLSKGRFTTVLNEADSKLSMQEEKSAKGGPVYCSGVFATTEGRVYRFNRPTKRVLEIVGVDGIGYLILEGEQAVDPRGP